MAELSKFSSDFLTRLRSAPDRSVEPPEDTAPGADALALLHVFTPAELAICTQDAKPRVVSQIWRNSKPAPGYLAQQGRSLLPAARLEALTRIENAPIALALLQDFPDRVLSPTQSHFEALLAGTRPDTAKLSHVQMLALQEANRWAAALDRAAFTEAELRHAVENAAAVASIGHLLQEDFVGREDEIAALREFTGVQDKGLLGRLGDFVHGSDHQLMLIEGLGGVGKTALIGHFLHDNRNDDEGPRFPFAYLPCDSEAVDITKPNLLLAEAAAQMMRLLRLFNPDHGVGDLYEDFLHDLRNFDVSVEQLGSRVSSFKSQADRLGSFRSGNTTLAQAFVRLSDAICGAMRRKGRSAPPALLFFDTFEEVQFLARADLMPFWDLVQDLSAASPQMRVLVSGRPPLAKPPSHIRTRQVRLEALNARAAVELLQRDTGLPADVLTPVVRQIGGNPLNLRLAGRILKEDSANSAKTKIGDIQTRRLGLFRVGEEVIRGQLYRRVLDHIHDPDVRKLAHPGMILRRVTPALIRDVLAPVAELGSIDDIRAEALFEGLRAEHTLVGIESDGALRYREEVRGPMIAAMQADQPDAVRRIHYAAVDWYRDRETPVERAEYIYHSLMAGQDTERLDTVWTAEVGVHLGSAIAEMPPRAQIWLARRMSFELDSEVLSQAATEEWEDIIGPDVLSVMERGGAGQALELMGQRSDRTAESPLFALEARCHMSLDQPDSAVNRIEQALAHYPVMGNRGRKAELLWLLFQAHDQTGNEDAAATALDDLAEVARELPGRLSLVQALTARVGMALRRPEERHNELLTFRTQLAEALLQLSSGEIALEPDVTRAGLARLSQDQTAAMGKVMLRLGSNLYASTSRGKFSLPEGWTSGVAAVVDPLANIGGLTWLGSLMLELAQRYVTERDMRRMLDAALGVLGQGEDKTDPVVWEAACALIWEVLQAEQGDLRAATLAGIDDFRPFWQQVRSRVALA